MKLYVVVRKDLTSSQQAVQAGHAVAEFLLRCPDTQWNNGTLVYLGVPDELSLKYICKKLDIEETIYINFEEPDFGNTITAIASDCESKVFNKLNLL